MASTRVDNPFRDTDPSHRFNPPQSTFGFGRRSRPPPMQFNGEIEVYGRVPLKTNKLERRESKGGLRSIFTRNNKSERSIITPIQEDTPPVSAFSERSMRAVAERSLPRSLSIKRTTTVTSETTPTTPKPTAKMSRMNLRSKSVKEKKGPTKTPTKAPTKPPNASKPSPKSTKSSPRPPPRTSPAWDPPPLFQAYPQAIKHATLSASTLSADAILRISNHRRNNSLRDEIAQTQQSGGGRDPAAAVKKTEKARSKHRRQISGSISKAEWTQKIFVLVTSGYLLQYSGAGSFDRLPEKMMQLGKESVAFASDVIPGKHWVLQISQAMDADGTPAADSRSLLSRLAFRGADYRRTATSLLLVLNSAEEMDSWIAVVRREIEALGGKKHVSETGKPKPDDNVMQLRAQPSHRYLVQRDPDQFSNPSSPQSPGLAPPWVVDHQIQRSLEDAASALAEAPLPPIRPSTGHGSTSNSVTSHNEEQLESLRDSTNRFSYMSSGQRTLITSQGSTPATSPTRESGSNSDDFAPKISMEDSRPRPNASAINERRRSMQTMSIPVLEAHTSKNFRPHSTYGGSSRPIRSPSPITPNFSVPNSSGKRYPTLRDPTTKMPLGQTLGIPTIVTTTPSKSHEAFHKGPRKAPPIALTVTIAPAVSTVQNLSSPTRQLQVFTPTESSFKKLQQIKPAMIDIPPRSPSASTPSPNEKTLPPRRSSLMPLNSVETSHVDFQFPRRHSSMPEPSEVAEQYPAPPLRPAPLLPAEALSTPLPVSPYIFGTNREVGGSTESHKEHISPLPAAANTKSKLRRPISMQIRSTAPSPSQSPRLASKSPRHAQAKSPTTPSSLLSPSLQRLKVEGNAKTLANRKSMPMLVNGPPPLPPPDCALPPLPPGSSGSMKSPASPMNIRNSVQV
jgi:hypothetical protein